MVAGLWFGLDFALLVRHAEVGNPRDLRPGLFEGAAATYSITR